MKYKWILFDIDGTLFDYAQVEEEALATCFATAGLPFDLALVPIYRAINLHFWEQYEQNLINLKQLRQGRFEQFFAQIQVQTDIPAFAAHYTQQLGQHSQLMHGAEELIQNLHQKVGLALITNGLQDVQRPRWAKSPLRPYFDVLIISDEVGYKKPDPRIFEATFQQIGHPAKHEVLMVGDSLTADIQGGLNFGIDTCWFNPEGKPRPEAYPAQYEIQTLLDLLPLVTA